METFVTGDEIELVEWGPDIMFMFGGYTAPNFILISRIDAGDTETYSYFVKVGSTFVLPGTDMEDKVIIVREINVEHHQITLELINKEDMSSKNIVGTKRKIT